MPPSIENPAKGADGSRYQSIYEPTEPSQPMMSDDVSDEDRPQHQELLPLLVKLILIILFQLQGAILLVPYW